MTQDEGENDSINTDPELMQMLELADKDTETVLTTVVRKFKNSGRDIKDLDRTTRSEDHSV